MPPPQQDKDVTRDYSVLELRHSHNRDGNAILRFAQNDLKNSCKIRVSDGTATLFLHTNSLPKGTRGEKNIPSLEGRGSKGEGENQPSPQFSPIGEAAIRHPELVSGSHKILKRTYSPIHLFTYSPHKKVAFTLAEGATHVDTTDNVRHTAFTLAEVLITLGIIGIVAALTMPALIANYKNEVFATQTKKTYSTVLNAMNRWKFDEGAYDYADIFIQTKTKDELVNEFFSYLNTAQICKPGSSGCAPEYYKYPKAYNDGKGKNATHSIKNYSKAVLADGSIIAINPYVGGDSKCGRIFTNKVTDADGNWIPDGNGGYETTETYQKQCGVMFIDANGLKGPNQLGADAYSFIITNNKISNWHTKIESVLTDEKLNYINYDATGDFIN